ncbi:MAG: 2-aminoethylphosphonate--pyruvate aminotransferase [Bacteroidota bacterium]
MNIADFSTVGAVPEHLNLSVINMWTCDPIHPEQFYRTGFETIFFKHNRLYALSCVLSSVVPSDKEIVIAGQQGIGDIAEVAERFDIPYIVFDATPGEMLLVETFLSSRPEVSHLVLVIDHNDVIVEQYIEHLRAALDHKGIDLILYSTSFVESINDRTNGSVDYLIGGWDEFPDNSFVVARRNRLVQTEGNSRSLHFDLHAAWQWGLKGRGPCILPMEIINNPD